MYSSIALLLGHMVGDYWFQSDKMAINKSKKGREGRDLCVLHCLIYSICVALFVVFGGWSCSYLKNDLSPLNVLFGNLSFAFLIAYVTHYPIDRISFAWIWMRWMGSSKFEEVDGEVGAKYPDGFGNYDTTQVKINKRQYFIAPVYIAVDNSFHLVLMWILFSVLGK